MRQTATQSRIAASGIRTIGTKFEPIQAADLAGKDMAGLYAIDDSCQQRRAAAGPLA